MMPMSLKSLAGAADAPGASSATAACGCAAGRRRFAGWLLAGTLTASGAARAQIPECKRSAIANVVPAGSVESAAQQQYQQMMREAQAQSALAPASHLQLQRLRYIASRIVPFARDCNERAADWRWEVNLLGSKQLNAFCMPGGKIAFYSGILSQLQLSDDEVAMVMGHEIAHALLEHARERIAKSTGTSLGLRLGAAFLGLGNVGDIAAQGLANLASLKFGRDDELEADALGLVLAAQAGYDPRAGVSLWNKMTEMTAGRAPAQWLSTHPAGATRIRDIETRLPSVLPRFNAASPPDRRFAPPAKA